MLDRRLRSDGYVVVRLTSPSAAASLRSEFGEVHGWQRHQLLDEQPPDFEIAMWDRDPAYQDRIASMVDRHTTEPIARIFRRHRAVARSMMVKWPSEAVESTWSGVPDAFHSDASCVDERAGHRGYRVWLALQDATPTNGGLWVVPHTHRVDEAIRGWGVEPAWLAHHAVLGDHAVPVLLRAGEAVVFDPALVHRSGPNTTAEPRVAVSILLADPDSTLCVFRRRDDTSAELVPISPEFFVDGSYNDLEDLPATEVVAVERRPWSAAELARRLDRLGRIGRLERAVSSWGPRRR